MTLLNLQLHLKQSPHLQLGSILILLFLTYSTILDNQFVGDDWDFIVYWQQTKSWDHVIELLKGATPPVHEGVFRPIRGLFYLLTYQLWEKNHLFYHLFSITIHSLVTIFVYKVTTLITRNTVTAFIVTLLFALHPVHTESITYITSSFDVIGYVFFFAAFYYYLTWRNNQAFHHHHLFISLLLTLLAFLSEELTLTLPILIGWYELCFAKKKDALPLQIVRKTWPFITLSFIYLIIRFYVLEIGTKGTYFADSFYQTMLASSKAVVEYIKVVFWPVNLSLDHTLSGGISTFNLPMYNYSAIASQWLFDNDVFLSLGSIIGLLLLTWFTRSKHQTVAFSLGWFFIALLPVLNIIPIYTLFLEAYVYLASFGFCLLFGLVITKLIINKNKSKRKRYIFNIVGLAALLFTTIAYIALTTARNQDWQNEITLWIATAKTSPHNALIYYKLGSAYQLEGNLDQAEAYYNQALALKPKMPFVLHNLGIIYKQQGDPEKARIAYEKALLLNDKSCKTHANIGDIYLEYANYTKALEHYTYALSLSSECKSVIPNTVLAYNQKAKIFSSAGNYNEALKALTSALQLDPNSSQTYNNLGIVYSQMKELMTALTYFEKAVQIDPASDEYRTNLQRVQLLIPQTNYVY